MKNILLIFVFMFSFCVNAQEDTALSSNEVTVIDFFKNYTAQEVSSTENIAQAMFLDRFETMKRTSEVTSELIGATSDKVVVVKLSCTFISKKTHMGKIKVVYYMFPRHSSSFWGELESYPIHYFYKANSRGITIAANK